MRTFGVAALVTHLVLLALAAIMAFGSIGGFLGDPLMIVSALLGLLLWGTYIGLTIRAIVLTAATLRGDAGKLRPALDWTRALLLTVALLSVGTAFLLALGAFATCGPLYLSSLYHWGGLAGSVLGFAAYFAMPHVVRATVGAAGEHAVSHGWKAPLIAGAIVYGFWGVAWLVLYLLLKGDVDASTYPAAASSPYRLPYPAGASAWVIQGNDSSFNHDGEHAWDFRRACGTPVLAARGGTVTRVDDSNEGRGGGSPNNFIEVTHSDGTVARYLHIQKGSARVRTGAVARGAHLADVGNVGNSLTGHIHFVVERGGRSIPVSFRDVEDDEGIPRTFCSYESGN